MSIDSNQSRTIKNLLIPYMGNDSRRMYVDNPLFDDRIRKHIDWDGSASVFTPHLIEVINRHGSVHDMIFLLEEVRGDVGSDDQQAFDDLIDELRPPDPDPDPDEDSYIRAASATIVEIPDIDMELPDVPLMGRDAIMADLQALLVEKQHVLVHGFSGSGKTALASTVAQAWKDDRNENVFFVKAGAADVTELLEAVGEGLGDAKAVAGKHDDRARMREVAKLLHSSKISLMVVDDAWNGAALRSLLRAATGYPVLVTARKYIPITGEHRDIPKMTTGDAVLLLAQYIGREVPARERDDAARLCEKLGNHPFALRVLGKNMAVQRRSPAQMLERIADAPDMKIPNEFAEQGRESLAVLIERSLSDVTPKTRDIFMNIGAFFTSTITAEMMMWYVVGSPKISKKQVEAMRESLSQPVSGEVSMRAKLKKSIGQSVNKQKIDEVDAHLQELVANGLLSVEPPTDNTIEHYRLHDIAHLYVESRHKDNRRARKKAVRACVAFLQNHAEPERDHFRALEAKLLNLDGASKWAYTRRMWLETEMIVSHLYQDSSFFEYRGFYSYGINMLLRATYAAEQQRNVIHQGQYAGLTGGMLTDIGKYDLAIERYETALQIAESQHDEELRRVALGNLGNVYDDMEQYDEALKLYEEALELAQKNGHSGLEGAAIGNIGGIYQSLGQYETALEYHKAAYAIAQQTGDSRIEGILMGNIGYVYKAMGQYETALEYHEAAYAFAQKTGNKKSEGSSLFNLGEVHELQEQYDVALDYFEQALPIFRMMGAKPKVEQTEASIAKVQALRDGANGEA